MRISKTAIAVAVAAALPALSLAGSSDARAASKPALGKLVDPQRAQPHFKYPVRTRVATSTVLYDQTGTAVSGFPSQNFESIYDSYDAAGADDFVVGDAAGWDVSAFNFQVFPSSSPPADPSLATYDIDVYADAAGLPGGTTVCSYDAVSGTVDPAITSLSISLPTTCHLPPGTYWVSMIVNLDFVAGGQIFWSLSSQSPAPNANAAWENPGDAFGTGCTSWGDNAVCGAASGLTTALFQVVGSVGSGATCTPSGICLESTVGTDLSPGACGAVDAIDATVGDQLNFCYTVTNNTGVDLDYQSLENNVDGALLALTNQPLPPGGTFQYNHIATVSTTNTYNSTWTAQDVPPGYVPAVTGGGGCADRIFADGFGDAPSSCGGNFVDISGTGTPLGLSDDGSAGVTLPFSFNFYGSTSNLISVSNNGGIVFGASVAFLNYINLALPAASLSGPAILPLWDDFDSTSGDVYTDVRGSAPNRQFIVEWYNRTHFTGNTDSATFEVIFNEADGTLQFEYADVTYTGANSFGGSDPDVCDGGVCATIGLQSSPTRADQFSAFQAAVTDNSGITWTPTSPQVFTSTDSVTVNVGAPQIVVNPSPLTGSVVPGATTVVPFAIENHGDRDLNWSLTEAAPANLHFPPPGSRYAMPLGDPSKTTARPVPPALRGPSTKPYRSPSLPGNVTDTVPIFAADIYNNQFVSFDALNPGTVNNIAATDTTPWTGGAFIDGDFSKLYVIAGSFPGAPNADQFATIDTATGAKTVIGTADSGGLSWSSLAYDSTSGTMYAVAGCPSGSQLFTIDINTGVPTLVGSMTNEGCSITIAIDSAGQMYSIDVVNDALYAVDKTNANDSLIGSIGFNANYAQEMTFDLSTDILYYAAFNLDLFNDFMYTVDTGTGTTNLIGQITGGTAEIDGMGIETVGGPCSQPQDLPWLTLNPLVGTTPPLGSTPIDATVDATNAIDGDVLAGTVCATSNDPTQHMLGTPITIAVANPPLVPPTLTKAFSPTQVADAGVASTLTITLANANATPATLTAPLIDSFPANLAVAPTPNESTTCGGAVSAIAGNGWVALDNVGAAIPATGTCTVSVDVVALNLGTHANSIPAGSLQTDAGANAAPADATLIAGLPPTLDKAFAPTTIAIGQTSTLTITIGNPNAAPITTTGPLTDALPGSMAVDAVPNVSTTCGGIVLAPAGSAGVTLEVGALVPSGGCTVSVNVSAGVPGTYPNTIGVGALQTNVGINAAPATAVLDVTP